MTLIIYIILFSLAFAALFYYSGSEAGFISLNKVLFRADIESGNRMAKRLQKILINPDSFIGTTLFGSNLAHQAVTQLLGYICIIMLGDKYGAAAAVIFTTSFVLIFGEIIPKILFRNFSNYLTLKTGYIILISQYVFRPAVWIVMKFSNLLLFPFKNLKPSHYDLTKADFKEIFINGLQEGILNHDEQYFLDAAASLSSLKAVEVMNPIVDIFFMEKNQSVKSVITQIKKENLQYIPVYDGRIDNLIGYIDIVDIFDCGGNFTAADHLQKSVYVPETNTLDNVFGVFQKTENKMLFVVDEYGGCSGVIYLNDIIDTIFGLRLRTRRKEYADMIVKIDNNKYEIDTAYDVDDLNKYLNIKIPKQGFETFGGFINYLAKYVPEKGEVLNYNNLRIIITKASNRSVDKAILYINRK